MLIFSEAELVKLTRDELDYLDLGLKSPRFYENEWVSEVTTPCGTGRIDVLQIFGKRAYWFCEYKINAEVSGLIQLLEYRDKFLHRNPSRIIMSRMTLVAQFFSEEVILLAPKLNMQLVQAIPINKKSAKLIPLEMEMPRLLWKVGRFHG